MEQQENFDRIKNMFQQFVPPLRVMMENDERYDLYSAKEVEIKNRSYKEIYFGSVILKPKYTGFYFMPVYLFPEMLNEVPETLKKLQTGKSCFHIKKYDEELFKTIEELMKEGFATYKKH
ncbi:MAG TPA: hypothetical protein PLT47_11910, partial [Bacteroidales bacterium]|nr:hypothetical protein [Bacteroidales bacterium]